MLFSDLGIARTIKVARRDFLTFLGIPILQVSVGGVAGAFFIGNLVDDRHRRFCQDRERRRHDLEFLRTELLQRQVRLVLPGEQHVADAALDEGHGRAARTGIEHRHLLIELSDEILGFVRRAVFLLRKAPGRQIIPARAA